MVEGSDGGGMEDLERLIVEAVVDEAGGRMGPFADGEARSGGEPSNVIFAISRAWA